MNDEGASKRLIRQLKRWARKYGILIITVLHLGKKDMSSIGHIGSASDRYAQSTLTIEKNKFGQSTIHIGGTEVSPALVSEMQIQASRIANSKVWKVFQETFRKSAYLSMFEKSQSFADMQAGKGMLKGLEVLTNFVNTFKDFTPPKPPTTPKTKP